MELERLAHQVSNTIDEGAGAGAELAEPADGLFLIRHTRPTTMDVRVLDPSVCLILQGRKETTLGERTVRLEPGQSLLVSHDLPVTSRIVEASEDEPYLTLVLTLDLACLRGLYQELGESSFDASGARSFVIHDTDQALVDALSRYLTVVNDPREARVLAPLVLKEIHYRLLMAPHGGMLRQLLRHDSYASNISRAIGIIRRNFKAPLDVRNLALEAAMSPSSFHQHFKSITGTTPLRYQKDMRLLEAHRLLTTEGSQVTEAALHVGYESPTQFSREYARMFGRPPSADRQSAG